MDGASCPGAFGVDQHAAVGRVPEPEPVLLCCQRDSFQVTAGYENIYIASHTSRHGVPLIDVEEYGQAPDNPVGDALGVQRFSETPHNFEKLLHVSIVSSNCQQSFSSSMA